MNRRLRNAGLRIPVLGRIVAERDELRDELKRVRTDARRLRRRLANASCEGNRELGFVFIVAYGRSGSTLLQGVLNSIPGYLVRGENRDAMRHLFMFHQTCLEASVRLRPARGALDSTHPFYGIDGFPPDTSLRGIRRLAVDTILRPDADTRVSGFKEIRWDSPNMTEYVAFLRAVFPRARFVINTRNHADVIQSEPTWWAGVDDPTAELARIDQAFHRLEAELGDSAYSVHYDDYVRDPDALAEMHEWLGEPYEPDKIATVFSVRHSTG